MVDVGPLKQRRRRDAHAIQLVVICMVLLASQ